jgi:hypothetical protein
MSTTVSVPTREQHHTQPATPKPSNSGSGMQCEILNPAEYGAWDDLVDRSPHGTVFHYSWWLNIAAQKFDIVVVRDKHGAMCGGVPLPQKRRAGLKLFHAPQLTPFLGPIFDIEAIKERCDQLFLMRSAGELIAQSLPRFDSFRCMVGARGPDLQGFLWSGFRAELAYTFRMTAGTPVEQVEAHVTRTHLQKLSKAKRLGVSVTKNDDVDAFATLCKIGSVHGNRTLYPDELPIRLWSAASNNEAIAALLTVQDARTTYQIVSAFDSSQREIPGSYVLLWTALREALTAKRDFDFEGSALRGVEQYYRRWGPAAVPVWRLEKAGSFRGGLLQSAARYRARVERRATAN